ncbi:uncharacterized protein [Prorops nasuta]|uniref:uncharacterized protein n=1 Tax=Prorops nasuta TaxID=863751 RepID=UPI0034CE8948
MARMDRICNSSPNITNALIHTLERRDEVSCKNNIQETIGFLESLGFLINYKKEYIKNLVTEFRKKEECYIREFAHLIGNLVAASRAVKYAWIHIKTLERLRFLELAKNRGNYDARMDLSAQVREDLLWWEPRWEHKIEESRNSLRNDKFDCEVFTDASNSGWAAVFNENRIHGFWPEEETSRHINYLELLAIYKVLLSFLPLLKSKNKDDTSIIREAAVNCSEGLRQAFIENILQEDTIQILLAALSSGTQKQYNSSLRLWKVFCEKDRVNPFKPSIANVLNFFAEEFNKGASFGFKLGENKWINKFMRGVFRLRPSRPRYNFIWDVSKVLDKLRALASGHRVQTFAAIKVKNIKINPREIVITVPEFLKTSGPGRAQPLLLLPFFQENPNLCAARTLSEYLNRTSQFREDIETLFITIKKPFKGASSQTLSRWLKDTLDICGIDISIFKAH